MPVRMLAVAAAVVLVMSPAAAHDLNVGSLALTDLWTRATPPNAPAAGGFLTITNTGDTADRLVAVSSPQVELSEIHKMAVEDDVMTMRPLDEGLEIPANATVNLAPGGIHLMFIGLEAPLREGGRLPVTLTFEAAGTVETFLHIEAIGSRGPGGHALHGHDGMEQHQ